MGNRDREEGRGSREERGGAASPFDSSKLPAFREEPDRLVLTSPSFSVAFSTLANGAIVSLHHHRSGVELVEAGEATAEGALWVIKLVSGAGATVVLTSRTCAGFTHSASADGIGSLHLDLKWSGLRAGAAHLHGEVTAHFTVPHDGRAITAELAFDLPEGLSVGAVEFPRIGSLGAVDPLTEENVFLPLGDGVLIPDPRALAARLEGKTWEAEYPGPASLPLVGYSRGPGVVLWLSCRDPDGARKTTAAGGMPHSNRLSLWLRHYPQTRGEGQWTLGYPTTLGVTSGDWYEAAREYRSWAIRQPWCQRGPPRDRHLPALTGAQGMWLSHSGSGESANVVVRDLLHHVNAPLRLDWRDWHAGAPPEHFPPRDGDEGFAQAVRELAECGVYVQLAFEGRGLDRETAATLAGKGAARGAEGIYFQHLGRELAPQGAEAAREALSAARGAVGESYHLATDGPVEAYVEFLDAFLTEHTAAERVGAASERFGARWSPLPMFTAVYHEYCAQIAAGPTLAAARLPDPLAGRDFQAQFCLEIARGMIWGRQLALSHFALEQARDERNRRKLAFLAAALRAQAWGVGAVLPEAEFLGLLAVDAPSLEVELLVTPRDQQAEPKVVRRRMSPVLGAAWRVPGGGNALVMANIHDHPVEFSTLLRPGRMILNPPLHLVGQTFSEDGDAPAATLRASGTEVAGRLPARCLLLVTLY